MNLVLDHVSKDVGGETHIRDVSLTFKEGELNILLGATLSGKTSLMRLMAGLDRPTSGRIVMGGYDVTAVPLRRRSVAMVYQQFINYPFFTVFENIASPLRVAGIAPREIEARVREAARLLKLEPYLDRQPLQLSGGQQQRTAIARALVKRAELVLLDEPLANLDYKLREELREELPRLFGESGAVLVYATTDPAEALLLGGRTATLSEGRVTQFGATAQVYRRPQDLATARTFSDPPLNELKAEKRAQLVTLETGTRFGAIGAFSGVSDGAYTVAFRAHHLFLDQPSADAIALPSVVSVAEITGSETFIHVDLKVGERDHRLVVQVAGVRRFEPGATLNLYIDPHRLFLFDDAGRLTAAPDVARAA